MRLITGGFQKRITIAVTLGMSVILICFGIAGYLIIQQAIQESLNKKLALARLVRNHIDSIVRENLNRLYDISLSGRVDFHDGDLSPEKAALSIAHRYSIFTDGVFIIDRGGNILLKYPENMKDLSLNLLSLEPIGKILSGGKPVVSNIYTTSAEKKSVIFMLVPLKDRNGVSVGLAGGEIDPTNPLLSSMFHLGAVGKSHISLIDSNGVIIASSDQPRAFTVYNLKHFIDEMMRIKEETITTCDDCYDLQGKKLPSHVLASAPLQTAPWGITVAEPVDSVFAPVFRLKRIFMSLSAIFIFSAVILSIVTARSIVNPVNELIHAADHIANGNLSRSILQKGSDEIGLLGRSFETMRIKLKEANEKLLQYNLELEERVKERTQEITESRERIQNLLKRILTIQEDERKRLARELHDTVLQDISACLIKMDTIRLLKEPYNAGTIDEIRDITMKTINSVYSVIRGLRPSILDDLGIEASIYWILNKHLTDKGINYHLDIEFSIEKRFSSEVEITLFRMLQEAVVNIARHSNAKNVFVTIGCVKSSYISICIEDDGDGFDMQKLKRHPVEDGRGMGILGMKERALLIDGEFLVQSQPGGGTDVCIRIPLKDGGKDV